MRHRQTGTACWGICAFVRNKLSLSKAFVCIPAGNILKCRRRFSRITHYGELGCEKESDFYTAQQFHQYPLRATFADMKGYLNHTYPGACTDYSASMEELRKEYDGPVFSFEVGQYEVLPSSGSWIIFTASVCRRIFL